MTPCVLPAPCIAPAVHRPVAPLSRLYKPLPSPPTPARLASPPQPPRALALTPTCAPVFPHALSDFSESDEGLSERFGDVTVDEGMNDSGTGGHPGVGEEDVVVGVGGADMGGVTESSGSESEGEEAAEEKEGEISGAAPVPVGALAPPLPAVSGEVAGEGRLSRAGSEASEGADGVAGRPPRPGVVKGAGVRVIDAVAKGKGLRVIEEGAAPKHTHTLAQPHAVTEPPAAAVAHKKAEGPLHQGLLTKVGEHTHAPSRT